MNKKIKSILFILLCILPHNNTNTQTSEGSFSLFEKLPQVIFEHPYIATIIATLVSLFSAKRFFSRSPYTPAHSHTTITTITPPQQTKHIDGSKNTILYNCKTKQLIITRTNKPPIIIKHVTHYYPSKNINYFIAHQLKKRTGIKKILKNIIFDDPDISDVYKFFQQYMYETLLINPTSGEILSLGSAISVEFNEQQDELIILETHELSLATILRNFILTKLWITNPIKATPTLEHKIFNLLEKKYVSLPTPLINKQSVFFASSQDIVIIDKQGTTSWSKNSTKPLAQPFINHAIIKYSFDEETNAYQLSLKTTQNPVEQIFDNVHYFYTTPDKKYLILYILKDVQIIQGKTLLPDAPKENFITLIQNTSTETYIIDIASGKKLHQSSGVIMCDAYNDENNHLYILKQNDPAIGNINLEHILKNEDNELCFDDTHTLIISLDNKLELLEKNNTKYKSVNLQTNGQKVELLFKEIEQNTGKLIQEVESFFQSFSSNKSADIPYSITSPDSMSYYDYTYVGEKTGNDQTTKKSHKKPLAQGVRGFEWNIYDFSKASFKTILNTLKGPSNATICIANNKPNTMDYRSYKSLQAELAKVLTFIQKPENKTAIITIFLNNNDCDPTTIDQEISRTLQRCEYDPLLKPNLSHQGTILWPTIEDMRNQNKRLIFFNTINNDSLMTHSMKHANHTLLSFFHDNAAEKPELFELANQTNQQKAIHVTNS